MTEDQAIAILKELEILRKLKLLEFLDKGYSQAQLAKVLGVSQPTISRMVPNVTSKKARSDG
ncbi:helix-turn-helix domain-containing protein [Bradyrhizobium liaoningense]